MLRAMMMRWVVRAALALPARERLTLATFLIASPLGPDYADGLRRLGQLASQRSNQLFDRQFNEFLQREEPHDDPHPRGDRPR